MNMTITRLSRSFVRALLLGVGFSACVSTPTVPPSVPVGAAAPFTLTSSGSGRPVIFIPDLAEPGSVWDSTVAHFGGRIEAHVMEVAGFAGNAPLSGPSSTQPAPLLSTLKDALARTIVERHLHKPILVGHQFGATVAYWLASTEPSLVGGVVAIDAPPSRFDGSAELLAEAEEGRAALSAASPEQFARMMGGRAKSMTLDPARAAELAARAAQSTPAVVASAFYDAMTLDLRPLVAQIKAPVLVVLTTRNLPDGALAGVQRSYEEQLAAVPVHTLVVVPGAGHDVMSDAPDAFFAALDPFVAAAQAAPAGAG